MSIGTEIRQVPLAIVGMACRLPGANNLDAFWQMLVEGRSAVADLPESHFDRDLYYDPRAGVRNKSYTFRGAIVSRDGLDFSQLPAAPALFREADSSHQLLCLVASEAFRHAQYDSCNLPTRNVGVYVGHTIGSDLPGDIQNVRAIEETLSCLADLDLLPELDDSEKVSLCRSVTAEIERNAPKREQADSGLASHMIAGLISKSFGLNGPFMSVNAACASSLQALVIAGRALQRGQIDMALVGGASSCSRDWLVLFSQSTALSHADSRPFDHNADGLIIAEAYVAVVVKTLERALADRDTIHAVIRGMGISADGRGKTLWAPRAEGQIAAVRRAYGPGVDVADVQYIEAHATATQLGDATEIASLRAVFEGRLPPGRKIPIASVKANIGHALEAAGLVGLVKAALCMQKGLIPRAINIEELNPKVDWANAPVAVPLESIPWPEPSNKKPRRAAVNAFGIGGLNVHIVLDGAVPGPKIPAVRPSVPRAPAEDAVAIIGIGSVLPGALDAAGFWDLLESPEAHHRADRRATNGSIAANTQGRLGMFVDGFQYDWRRHRIPPKEIEVADPLQFMVLDAADQALHDAGYDQKKFDRTRSGVIVGTEFTGEFGRELSVALRLPYIQRIVCRLLAETGVAGARAEAIANAFAEAWHTRHPVLRDNTGSFSASSLAVRIAKTWNLMGCAAALDSGTTSGMSALSAAFDLLVCGDCDLMICAGAQRQFDPVRLDSRPSANHEGLRGPFDRNGTGFLRGEGAAVLLMKRLQDALADGDRIHAVVLGIASCHDAARNTLTEALDRSLELSGRSPNDLAMVLSDACGIREVDEGVARAVMASQSVVGRSHPLPLGSVIGQIGHLGGASSLASLVAAILAFRERLVPAAPGIVDPIPTLRRNCNLMTCSRESIRLGNGHLQLPALSAVLSHGQGLAYAAVIEAAK